MGDCVFCKIISGELKSEVVLEKEHTLVIKDINPQAPVHYLIIPKRHVETVLQLQKVKEFWEEFPMVVEELAKMTGLGEVPDKGFRIVVNCGKEGGQEVYHLHFHFIGGRKLSSKLG